MGGQSIGNQQALASDALASGGQAIGSGSRIEHGSGHQAHASTH